MTFSFPELALMATAASVPAIWAASGYLGAGDSDVSLRRSRRTELGLVDYFPFEELVEPDTILTTYGALGALFEITWDDTSVESDDNAMRHVAWINDGLKKFGAGWMVQTYALRRDPKPLTLPTFLATDAAHVLAESHATYASSGRYDVRHIIAVTYLPPTQTNAKAQDLIFTGESPVEVSYEKVREAFERGLRGLEDSLNRIGRLRRLGARESDSTLNELLEAVFEILYDDVQPIRAEAPCPIGGLLAARDMSPVGLRPKLGGKHLRVLSVYGLPGSAHPGMMEAFLRVPVSGCRFTTRSIFQNIEQAKAKLDAQRNSWAGQRTSLVSKVLLGLGVPPRVNRFAALKEEQAEESIAIAQSGHAAWVHFNAKAVFFNEDVDALKHAIREVRKALQSVGFTVNEETINTVDAYFGHVPFDGFHDVREGQVHTLNVGRMIPSSSRWSGRTTWNCKHCGPVTVPALTGVTDTGERFDFDPHDEEDTQSFVAIGSPGSGKTTDLNTLAANYRRAPNDQVFTIDKNRGQFVTCAFLGGDYRESSQYCLFDGITDPQKLIFTAKFLTNLAELNGIPVTPEHREIVKRTLEMMVNDPARHRSLSTFLGLLAPKDHEGGLTQTLAQYATGGIYRGIFDGIGSGSGSNSYEVHELGSLLGGMQDDRVAAPVLIWILNSFEDRLPGHRSIILVDEAWAALKSPLVAGLLEDEMRTLRFRHAGIGFFTHTLAEVKDSAIGKVVFATCKQRLLYPNPEANGEFRSFFKALDLNDAQINVLKSGVLKRDCSLSVNGKFGTFQLRRSPAELAVYGCTGIDQIAAARKLMTEYPDDWRERHLRAYGCNREADRLRSLRVQGVTHSGAYTEAIAAA